MRAVLLDGTDGKTSWMVPHIVERVQAMGYTLDNYHLEDEKVKRCLGCFGCWVKTPGECIIDDIGRKVTESWVKSDLLIITSPVLFGTYSFNLKKALDRILPILLPYFIRIKGEVHHPHRYGYKQRLLVFGHVEVPMVDEEEAFRDLVLRNALNFHVVESDVVMLTKETVVHQVNDAFSKLEGASS